jgi:hypothetical protein
MAEEKDKKNKFQQRMDEQAAAVEKAYAELREVYDDPTDEQILAVAGNNLRGYQRKIGNTAGNWGTALGSNAVWGTLNKNTRNALEAGYQSGLEETKKSTPDKRAEVKFALGDGEGAKKVTRGMQIDARNWGDNITDVENITPEQVRRLNEIMSSGGFTNFAIPTKQVTTKNENGKDVTTDVEQNISLYDLLESATPEEIEALEYLGFIDEDGAYIRPHNETFDEKLARKERERERIDLLAQQRALDRQRARTGLADLAAGIGDMIKASNGAIVTPRDYKAMYDSLTEQQKTNYNNYLARMQAMKEAEKAKAKEAADRAYQEKMLAEQRAYQEEQTRKAQDFQASENQKNRDWEDNEREDEQAHQISMLMSKIGSEGTADVIKGDGLYINNTRHQSDDSIAIALYTKLNGAKYKSGRKIVLSPLPENLADVDRIAIRLNVQKVLDNYDDLPKELQTSVMEILGVSEPQTEPVRDKSTETNSVDLGIFGKIGQRLQGDKK